MDGDEEQQPNNNSHQCTVAIIGSTFATQTRGKQRKWFTKQLFERMTELALETMAEKFHLDPKSCHVVSGGSAWSDHVGVDLFLRSKVAGLKLHLLAPVTEGRFTSLRQSRVVCNIINGINKYHGLFSSIIQRNTFEDLTRAIDTNSDNNIVTHKSLFPRNSQLASEASHVIAFVWKRPDPVTTGDIIKRCRRNKIPTENIVLIDVSGIVSSM